MYAKKVLIFNQVASGFSQKGRQLCGMAKLATDGKQGASVTVFVTNADVRQFGEWWIVLYVGEKAYAHNLETLNNCIFEIPETNLSSLAALLVKRNGTECRLVAESSLSKVVDFKMRSEIKDVIEKALKIFKDETPMLETTATAVEDEAVQSVTIEAVEAGDIFAEADSEDDSTEQLLMSAANETETTPYEKFVASTQNFYTKNDVENLRNNAKVKLKSIEEYSAAFERYYATGRGDNYYESVKNEITKLFIQFPPHFPLIEKYKESYFVRIDFPTSGKYFVLGVVERERKVKYICYGVPGQREGFSDKDFIYVENSPDSFWMLFQDAETGQITAM